MTEPARIVLYGGGDTVLTDTWLWNGDTGDWEEQFPASNPGSHLNLSQILVWDPVRGLNTLLELGDSLTMETWTYDGTDWAHLSTATTPTGRDEEAWAFDVPRGKAVMYGGELNLHDTWAWDGTDWTQLSPATTTPRRRSHAVAYDEANDNVVMYGGIDPILGDTDDTWIWDGSDWTLQSPVHNAGTRRAHSMAYHEPSGGVVLFGSEDTSGTYVWDGSDWTEIVTAHAPNARDNSGLARDPVTGDLIFFGGAEFNPSPLYYSDTWKFDGSDWTQLSPVHHPSARFVTAYAPGIAGAESPVAVAFAAIRHSFGARTP